MTRLNFKVPAAFDPTNKAHIDAAMKRIAEMGRGTGWEVQSYSPDTNTLTVIKRGLLTQVGGVEGSSRRVELSHGLKPSDGEQIAAQLESDPQHEGFYMTRFEPYLATAVLSKLTPDQLRARGAVATVLGVKPWDVQVAARKGGGYTLQLPPNYVPSKHDEKLNEIAQVAVGKLGWYFRGDAATLTGEIVPAQPATFPKLVPYPVGLMPTPNTSTPAQLPPVPIGMKLAERGDKPSEPLFLDLEASPHLQLGGTSGAGKLLALDTPIPTPTGWTTMGELKVGDQVYGRDGRPCRVTFLSDIDETPDLYRVTFSDGQTIDADADHQWVVSSSYDRSRPSHIKVRNAHRRWVKRHVAIGELRALAVVMAGRRAHQNEILELIGSIEGHDWRNHDSVRQALKFMGVESVRTMTTATRPERAIKQDESGRIATSTLTGRTQTFTTPQRDFDLAEALTALADRLEFLAGEEPGLKVGERIMTTGEMLAAGLEERGGRMWAIHLSDAIDGEHADLPVAPYTLGAWLGDGTSREGAITTVDPEIIDQIQADGYRLRRVGRYGSKAPKYVFDDLYGSLATILGGTTHKGKLDKRIPVAYLRASHEQRLALLQGLMDTDGTISGGGGCELTLCKEDLARDALELIRSLGIRATFSSDIAAVTQDGNRRVVGTRWRIRFTTNQPVFRLPRKADRLPAKVRRMQEWLYIVSIEKIEPRPGRCIQVDSPDSTYLAGGFIPTHNTVTLNTLIAGALAGGAELAIADVPQKAVDFESWRPFVRPGGWGCESFEENAIMLEQLYKEGEQRAATLKRYGAKKLADLPADVQRQMRPVLIVVDEVTGLFAKETVPKALPEDHPLRVEAGIRILAKELIKSYIEKIAAEQRFVGYKLVISTQVASTDTGVGTALRTNLGNKALLGARATDNNRRLILRDPTSVPQVPDHVKSDPDASRGVGVSEFEGQAASVFKSFFASEQELIAQLQARGLSPHPAGQLDSITRPDPRKVIEMFPDKAMLEQVKREAETPKVGQGPRQYEAWELDPETGKPLDGFARANMARHLLTKNAPNA